MSRRVDLQRGRSRRYREQQAREKARLFNELPDNVKYALDKPSLFKRLTLSEKQQYHAFRRHTEPGYRQQHAEAFITSKTPSEPDEEASPKP